MPKRHRKRKYTPDNKLILKEDGQEYAYVTKVLGSCRFRLKINLDPTEKIGQLRGTLKGRYGSKRVDSGSVVLVGLREYQDGVVDIMHVYNQENVKKLKKIGEYIDENQSARDNDDCGIEFALEEDSKKDEEFDFTDL